MPRSFYSQYEYSGTRWTVSWVGLRAVYGEELLLLTGFEPWVVHPVAILSCRKYYGKSSRGGRWARYVACTKKWGKLMGCNWYTLSNKNPSGITLTTEVHSCQQKSIGLKFSKSRTGSDVRYSCHHNSSRFTTPIFAHSCRFSVFHSLQSITPRIY